MRCSCEIRLFSRLIGGQMNVLVALFLYTASQLSGKQFESLTKDAVISPELMNSLLTRTVNPNEVTVVKDNRGRSVITVKNDRRQSQGQTSRRHEKKTGYKSSGNQYTESTTIISAIDVCHSFN